MKIRVIAGALLLGLMNTVMGQVNSYQLARAYVYRLSDSSAVEWVENRKSKIRTESLVFPPVDTLLGLYMMDTLFAKLSPGYYVLEHEMGQNIFYRATHLSELEVIAFPQATEGSLWVRHPAYSADSLQVFFRNNLLKYEHEFGTYRLPVRKKGLLRIQTPKETAYYFWRGNRRKKVVYLSHDLSRNTVKLQGWKTSRNYNTTSYLALSQPVYQPGDTLKLKAFLSKKEGIAYNEPVVLAVTPERTYRARTLDTIYPQSPGIYIYEYPIPDSLELDRSYEIEVRPLRNSWTFADNSFRYEAYELDAYRYEAKVAADQLSFTDTVKIEVAGTDATGAAATASVEVQVRLLKNSVAFAEISQSGLKIPRIVYEKELDFDQKGTVSLAIPVNTLPKIQAAYRVGLVFRNPANELQEKELAFTVIAEKEAIPKLAEETLIPPIVSVKGLRKADSVFFSITNPENALLHCRLIKGKTTLSHFWLQKDSLISLGNAAGASFLLAYDMAWKGERLEREEILPYHPKLLNVSIDQPENIYPGQQVETRIRVTDSDGQPVSDLDLTAWGINAQFPTENLPELRLADVKNSLKWRIYDEEFRNQGIGDTKKNLRRKNLSRFGLEDSTRYRLFFPDTLEQIYLPVGQAESQVAPYVYDEGKRETILLIWIDDRLVYYYDTDMEAPYSFAASPGRHTLRIRTKEDEYTLSNVELREGYKLELSFNPKRFAASITKAYVGPRMLPREAAALNASMVWLAPNWKNREDVWVWQENRKYRIREDVYFRNQRALNPDLRLIGPFSAESVEFAIMGKYRMSFQRSWGKAYLLTRGQVYQEPLRDFFQPGEEWIDTYENIPVPGELLIDEKEWEYLLTQKNANLPSSIWISEQEGQDGKGDLRLFVNHQLGVEAMILQKLEEVQNVWVRKDTKPYHDQFLSLASGNYRLLLRNREGAIAKIDSIEIEAGVVHFLKAMDLKFEQNPQWLDFFSATQRSFHTPAGLRFYNYTYTGGSAAIQGKLLDTHEIPISGAEVLLMRGFQQLAGNQTDSAGHFQFSDIGGGDYQLVVIHPRTGIRQFIIETSPDSINLIMPQLEAPIPEIAFLLQHDHGFSIYRNREKLRIWTTCEVPDTATSDAFLIPTWQQWSPSEKKEIEYLFERESDTAEFRLIQFSQISGSIFDSQTGLPIKGKGNITTGGQKLSFSTNSEGRFTRSVRQESGTDTLTLSLPGYYPLSLSLPIEDVQLSIQKNTADAYWKRTARKNRMRAKRRFLALNYFSGGTSTPKPPSGMQSSRFRRGTGHYGELTGAVSRQDKDAYSYTIASDYTTLAKSKPARGEGSLWWTIPLREMHTSKGEVRRLTEVLSRDGDLDGIPDMYDKEPNSSPYSVVDASGRELGYIALGDFYAYKNQEIALLDSLSGFMRSYFQDCAFWRPTLTTDSNGEVVFTTTFPEDITTWKTFVVAMNAQQQVGFGRNQVKAAPPLAAALRIPRFMLAGDSVAVRGMGRNYSGEKAEVQTLFKQGDRLLARTDTLIETSLLEQTLITTTDTGDLSISYELSLENGYRDGEQREVSVLPVGDRETTGSFHYLEGDTTVSQLIDPANGPLEIRIAQSGLEQLLVELESLKGYPHACTEQISSKLLAFVVERETFKALGREWKGEKTLNRLVRQLERRQLRNGTWAWWVKGETDYWMTAYATYALHRANPKNSAGRRGKQSLLYLSPNQLSPTEKPLRLVLWMAEMEIPTEYEQWVNQVGQKGDLYDKLLQARIRQLRNLSIDIPPLLAEGESDALGGMYWGESGWKWNGNKTEMTLLAYDILKSAGGFEAELAKIRQFLLMQAPRSRNTIESANVLTHLLPDMRDETAHDSAAIKMKFGKQEVRIDEFPAAFFPESFPGDSIQFIKKGTSPIFISISQSKYDPEPLPVDSLFRLKTHFVQDGKSVEVLQTGQKVEMMVTVEVLRHAEYLNLEIPVPATCSYGEKIQPSGEAHREYETHRTLIYLRQLSPGSHRFRIPLEVRFSGVFTVNPPRVELMYTPTYMGRGETVRIKVRE